MASASLYGQSMSGVINKSIESEGAAGAQTTMAKGSSSLEANPANLTDTKNLDLDWGVHVTGLSYTYEPVTTEVEGAKLDFVAPIPYVGGSYKPRGSILGFGATLEPVGTGSTMKMENIPFQFRDKYQSMDIESKSSGFKTAMGMSLDIMKRRKKGMFLSLGASGFYSQESQKMTLGNETGEVFEGEYDATNQSYNMGLLGGYKVKGDKLVLGLSYRPENTKEGEGTAVMFGSLEGTFTPSFYTPPKIGLGAQLDIYRYYTFADYSLVQWSQGRDAPGMSFNTAKETNYLDQHNIVLGAGYRLNKARSVQAAYGYYPGNMGEGELSQAEEGESPEVVVNGGGKFGSFDSITRHVVSGAYKILHKDSRNLHFVSSYGRGYQQVAEGQPGEGLYTFDRFVLGIGGHYNF